MTVVLTSEQDSKLCSSFCIFLVACAFLGGGVYTIHRSTQGTREAQVAEYSAAVTAWSADGGGRAEMAATSFEVVAMLDNAIVDGSSLRTLVADETADPLEDHEADQLPTYTALKYVNPADNELFAEPLDFNLDVNVFFAVNATYGTGDDAIVSSFMLGPVLMFSEQTMPLGKGGTTDANRCGSEFNGVWKSQRRLCLMAYRADAACFQLSFDADTSAWAPLEGLGNGGCASQDNWQPYTVVKLPLEDRATTSPVPLGTSIDFEDFGFTLRSSKDPFMDAEAITQDELDFGLTEGELLSLGIVCIIVGFILCINPILYAQQIYGLCEADKRRGSGKEPAFTGLGGIGDETHDDEGGDDDGGDDDGKLAELGGDRYMDAVHAARGGASGDGGVELTDRR